MKVVGENKEQMLRFCRFVIVGVVATGLHYLIYWIMMHWIDVSVAYTIGYVLSFCVNYLLTTFFTFKKEATVKNGIGFGFAHLVNYLVHIGLLQVVLWLGVSKTWAPLPVFCIAIPLNFLILSRVFNTRKRK